MAKEILGIGSRVKHPEFGDGVVIQASSYAYTITFMQVGIREISHEFEGLEVIDVAEMEGDLVSLNEVEERLINILRKFSDVQETVELGNKWLGGKFILQPADKNLKGKEIPINAFFQKIVMLRAGCGRYADARLGAVRIVDRGSACRSEGRPPWHRAVADTKAV
jgi:hypothetical protein